MKKILLGLMMGLVAPLMMAAEWKNEPTDSKIQNFFQSYFVKGTEKVFHPGILVDMQSTIVNRVPDFSNKWEKISQLIGQFVTNVTMQDILPIVTAKNTQDKETNKINKEENKKIVAHNKEAQKRKNEIKSLLKGKSNPIETVGGLAAIVYEYSDRAQDNDDKSLKLFKRYIALRADGYYKEYFLYDVVDDEKTSKDKLPRYFYRIKTHRPKSWSALLGVGKEYVDKRGWLSYAYDNLKLPVLALGAVAAWKNREAIAKKFDESGIKETPVGKWVGDTYTKARGAAGEYYTRAAESDAGKYVATKGRSARDYAGNLYGQASKSTYAGKAREAGSYVGEKAGQLRAYVGKKAGAAYEGIGAAYKGTSDKVSGAWTGAGDYLRNYYAKKRPAADNQGMADLENKEKLKLEEELRLRDIDTQRMAEEMENDRAKLFDSEARRKERGEAALAWDQQREEAGLKRDRRDYKAAMQEENLLWDQQSEQAGLEMAEKDYTSASRSQQREARRQKRYDRAYADRGNMTNETTKTQEYDKAYQGYIPESVTQPEERVMQEMPVSEQEPAIFEQEPIRSQVSELEEPIVQPEPMVMPQPVSPVEELASQQQILNAKKQLIEEEEVRLTKEKAINEQELKQEKEEVKEDIEKLKEIKKQRKQVKKDLKRAAAERKELEIKQAEDREKRFKAEQEKGEQALQKHLENVRNRGNKSRFADIEKGRGREGL